MGFESFCSGFLGLGFRELMLASCVIIGIALG